jgi:hypothetical protein
MFRRIGDGQRFSEDCEGRRDLKNCFSSRCSRTGSGLSGFALNRRDAAGPIAMPADVIVNILDLLSGEKRLVLSTPFLVSSAERKNLTDSSQ